MEDFAPQARRVISMEQSNGETKGTKKLLEYLGMTTKITAVDGLQSDAGKTITYQFNDSGNVVCMFDELGYAQSATFSESVANTPMSVSKLQRAVINQIRSIGFEANWTAQKASADTIARDTATKCLNMPSVKMVKKLGGRSDLSPDGERAAQRKVHPFGLCKGGGLDRRRSVCAAEGREQRV